MFLRQVYDESLAQAAYLIGCQASGEAIVIDPERDVDRYVQIAQANGMRITAVGETHIHADFVSGARELAERTGAMVYVSGEGGPEWSSRWLDKKAGGGSYRHRVLKDGETFRVGNIEFEVVHTPGHTPEHISFLVSDRGAGATEPMGVLTGDFVFVGDVGRPDLLETAAGQEGSKEPAARRLLESVRRFDAMPEYLQVWPAHGAGSACGKALGAVPQSTVGYEKRFNAAIRAASSERGFLDFVLSGQPEPPMYFARMKRVNRDGPAVLGSLPRPARMDGAALRSVGARRGLVIDCRPWRAFREGHVPGSLHIPLDGMFASVAGSFIEEGEEIVLVVEGARAERVVRELVRIGLDTIAGSVEPSDLEAYRDAGGVLVKTPEIDCAEASARVGDATSYFLDVRRADEFAEGHIPGATNIAYQRLAAHLPELPRDRRIVVNCRSGARSARACSFLERQGYEVANVAGGYLAWRQMQGEAAPA